MTWCFASFLTSEVIEKESFFQFPFSENIGSRSTLFTSTNNGVDEIKLLCSFHAFEVKIEYFPEQSFQASSHIYRPQGKVMFSQASVILYTISLMATRSLLILVTARLVSILLEYFLAWRLNFNFSYFKFRYFIKFALFLCFRLTLPVLYQFSIKNLTVQPLLVSIKILLYFTNLAKLILFYKY